MRLSAEGFESRQEHPATNERRAVERRARDMGGPIETSEDMSVTQERRRRVDDLRLVFAVDKEVTKENAKWWGPELNAQWDAAHASPSEGADAASSVWATDQCNIAPGRELSALVKAARER